MFEALSERLQKAFRGLRGHGHLTETELRGGLREIRLALLEADVHLQVVKELIERVRRRAGEEEILKSLTPGQQVVKLQPPGVVLMVGLQGSGKTTSSGKLARWLKERGKSPLLVAADVRRPAAVDQLQVLGRQLEVPVITVPGEDAAAACRAGLREARLGGRDPVLVDTAGRLHIDDELMTELAGLKEICRPQEILYVADAMIGQDAVRAASAFHERLGLTGVVLSKADGDARGGAILSVRHVTGVPVKFVGMGEHLGDLETFESDRMVSRILGMGDVLSLIEKAESVVSREEAEETARRMRRDELTLEDLLDQLDKVSKMGSLRDLIGMLPGASAMRDMPIDEGGLVRTRAIIGSMTRRERLRPACIDGSRRRPTKGVPADGSAASLERDDLSRADDRARRGANERVALPDRSRTGAVEREVLKCW
jgi:signal recognition particle subunit SRP54